MTTATEAPIETKAAPAVSASATPAAPVTQPAGVAATTAAAAAGPSTAVDAKAAAPAAPERLLADKPVDPKAAETVKVEAIKPADITLKAPEGVEIVDADLRSIEAFAKENGLSQAQAEKILARDLEGRTALKTSREAEITKASDTWLEQTKALPEFAGDKLGPAVENAKRAMVDIYTPEERKLIAESAFANHPLLLKALARHGASLPKEDTIHAGAAKAEAARTGPQILYPMYYKA
jgi:hypothetical protein